MVRDIREGLRLVTHNPVLRALKELNLENDTIVLYTSDHGEMLGEHKLWNKFVFYEASVDTLAIP